MIAAVIVALIINSAGSAAYHISQVKQPREHILLIIEVNNRRSEIGDLVAADLAQRIFNHGIEVTLLSELKKKDRLKVRRAAAATVENDRKILRSFSFTATIIGQFSTKALAARFYGNYGSDGTGTLKAIRAANGKTIAAANIQFVRDYAPTQRAATHSAVANLGSKIPSDFIDQVVKRLK